MNASPTALPLTPRKALVETLQVQLDRVLEELIARAKELPQFARLTSLSGVGKRLGALFLAEVRDLSRYTHYKQIEKLAGLNLQLYQSGRYTGSRHLSHIGNPRLRWIIYMMTEETAKRVPEVRIKYLRRQLKRRRHVRTSYERSANPPSGKHHTPPHRAPQPPDAATFAASAEGSAPRMSEHRLPKQRNPV